MKLKMKRREFLHASAVELVGSKPDVIVATSGGGGTTGGATTGKDSPSRTFSDFALRRVLQRRREMRDAGC